MTDIEKPRRINQPTGFSRVILEDLIVKLKQVSRVPDRISEKHKYAALHFESRKDLTTRAILELFYNADKKADFVAVVEQRGFSGKHRNVLVKDLRLFGVKYVFEDHLWLPYTKLWERIEPFLQGQKVMFTGYAMPYRKSTGETDFTIDVEALRKL